LYLNRSSSTNLLIPGLNPGHAVLLVKHLLSQLRSMNIRFHFTTSRLHVWVWWDLSIWITLSEKIEKH